MEENTQDTNKINLKPLLLIGLLVLGIIIVIGLNQRTKNIETQKSNIIRKNIDSNFDDEDNTDENINSEITNDSLKNAPISGEDSSLKSNNSDSSSLIKEFVVTGTNFKYDLTQIKVKQGDKVRILFKNSEGMHDWKVDEFNAATKVISAGQEETIEFTADKKGQFEYYCSVGKHREMGMKGNLIVE